MQVWKYISRKLERTPVKKSAVRKKSSSHKKLRATDSRMDYEQSLVFSSWIRGAKKKSRMTSTANRTSLRQGSRPQMIFSALQSLRGRPFDLWRGGGGRRFEKKVSCKAFTVKKSYATWMAVKNACTALKKLPAPLASEKKTLALTNSSTLPFKG